MKHLIPLVLSIILINNTFAQNLTKLSFKELDSLIALNNQKQNYQQSLLCAQTGKEKAIAAHGAEDTLVGKYTEIIGTTYTYLGNFEIAVSLFLESKEIYSKKLGQAHPYIANCLHSLGSTYKSLGKYDMAENAYLQAKEIRQKAFGKQSLPYATTLNGLAVLYKDKGIFEKSEAFFVESKNIRGKILGTENPDYAVSLNNLASLYEQMGMYEKAEPLYIQSKNLREKLVGTEHTSFAVGLNNLGFLYYNMEKYDMAEPLFVQAKNITEKIYGSNHPEFAVSLHNLASLYALINKTKQAEILWAQAKNVLKVSLGENHPFYATCINNLALLHEKDGLIDLAEDLYIQAKNIREKIFGKMHPSYGTSLNNLGLLYTGSKNYIKAKSMFSEARAIFEKSMGMEHPLLAASYNNLARVYWGMGELDSAFYYCQLSIAANSADIDSAFVDFDKLPEFKYYSIEVINTSMGLILSILDSKFKTTNDIQFYKKYYEITHATLKLNNKIKNDFNTQGDKLRTLATVHDLVLGGIRIGLSLNKTPEELLTLAETNKGVLLMDASKTAMAHEFGDLPDSLITQERSLQKTYSDLQAKLLEKRTVSEKDSLLAVLNKTNHDIEHFTRYIKKKYPQYAQLKYEQKIASTKEIQSALEPQTALLEYVIGDSSIYIFYVDKSQILVFPQQISSIFLAEKIKTLHHVLSDYQRISKEKEIVYRQYTENAFWFYQQLIEPVLAKASNKKNIKKLVVIADQELGHLPFDVFLTKPAPQTITDYKELNYLLRDYAVSYDYSASIFLQNKNVKNSAKSNGQILAMAANYAIHIDSSNLRLPSDYLLRKHLNALPAAQKEIETLSKNFNGFFAFDKDASEKNFKEKAGDYTVIHLAMHGLLDSKNPILSSLAFTEDGDSLENNFLQAYEISKMKLNADLVVLSACETGYGKFQKGNGIASLAQAFAYAGAPAMIVSLWQVNDYATSEIMKNLYQNLADGMPKDEALQEAKIKYIKEAADFLAHPAFWSPFILMGNTDAVVLNTENNWWGWAIGIGIFALLGGLVWVRREK